MEHWELIARESIRDLVARYNANGDSGRFDPMLELFAEDATMELPGASSGGSHNCRRRRMSPQRGRESTGTAPLNAGRRDAPSAVSAARCIWRRCTAAAIPKRMRAHRMRPICRR